MCPRPGWPGPQSRINFWQYSQKIFSITESFQNVGHTSDQAGQPIIGVLWHWLCGSGDLEGFPSRHALAEAQRLPVQGLSPLSWCSVKCHQPLFSQRLCLSASVLRHGGGTAPHVTSECEIQAEAMRHLSANNFRRCVSLLCALYLSESWLRRIRQS